MKTRSWGESAHQQERNSNIPRRVWGEDVLDSIRSNWADSEMGGWFGPGVN